MTLVRINDENAYPMMLSVQQHHHHNNAGLHNNNNNNNNTNSNIMSSNGNNTMPMQSHRGNVIVSTGGLTNDLKMQQCKRTKMYQTTPYGTVPHQPASVARRNARERNRVKQVNNGFATLRQHIPQSVAQALGGNTAGTHGGARAGSKKLSKVETLRMAVEYIRSLQRLLDDESSSPDGSSASSSPSSSTCGSNSHIDIHTNELHSPHIATTTTITTEVMHHRQHVRQNPSPSSFVPPPCSEASSSPTPSFVSETSSAGSQGYGSTSTVLYTPHSDNNYDPYEPLSPNDENEILLDAISWWQQSQ